MRAACPDAAIVVTPNLHVHALFADKRSLSLLSDQALLRSWGVTQDILTDLAGVPALFLSLGPRPRLGNAKELVLQAGERRERTVRLDGSAQVRI